LDLRVHDLDALNEIELYAEGTDRGGGR